MDFLSRIRAELLKKDSADVDMDTASKITAQDFLDAANEEVAKFKYADIVTGNYIYFTMSGFPQILLKKAIPICINSCLLHTVSVLFIICINCV